MWGSIYKSKFLFTNNMMPFWKWFKGYKVRYDISKSNPPALTYEDLKAIGVEVPRIDFGRSYHGGSPLLKKVLSGLYNVSENNVFIGNSASDTNDLAFDAFIRKGCEVLVELPVYPPLLEAARRRAEFVGAKVRQFHRSFENGFKISFDELSGMVNKETKLVVMTNLHNPTGISTSDVELKKFSKMLPEDCILMVDEVYRRYDENLKSIYPLSSKGLVIDSITKYYGIASLRVGWAIGDKSNVEELESVKGYRCVVGSAFSEDFVASLLQHKEFFEHRVKEQIENNFKIFEEWVSKRNDVSLVKPQGYSTCCFPRLDKVKDTYKFVDYLIKEHDTVFVPGELYGLNGHIRVCFGCETELLEKALENLGKVLETYKKE